MWAGMAAVGFIVGLFAANLRWDVEVEQEPPPRATIGLDSGCLLVSWDKDWTTSAHDPVRVFRMRYPFMWRTREWWPRYAVSTGRHFLRVPIWFAFVVTAMPTGFLWFFDRRYVRRVKEGYCSECGYDCRSLGVEALCPECGAERRRGRKVATAEGP